MESYRAIRHELAEYSDLLADKVEVLVASKMDLDPDEQKLREFEQRLGREVSAISAVSGKGLGELTEKLWTLVQQARGDEANDETE